MPSKLSVLRECSRVLKPGGQIVGFIIHPPEGLSEDQLKRAAELGPSEVVADTSPVEQLVAAGFVEIEQRDLTEGFALTCRRLLQARADVEQAVRRIEGDEAYDEELTKKRRILEGISAGLLRRSLLTARKPIVLATDHAGRRVVQPGLRGGHMNRGKVATLHNDPRNWRLGVVYHCPNDPRIVVPNRWWIGWTWNLGHRWVIPAIVTTVVGILAPSLFLTVWVGPRFGFLTATVLVLVVVFLGYRNASGPHG